MSHKVLAGGGTLLGQDISGNGAVDQAGLGLGLGPVFPKTSQQAGAGTAAELRDVLRGGEGSAKISGRKDVQDLVKSGYGENARIISDVIQPASFSVASAPKSPSTDVDSFREHLIASGYVRASEVS